MTDVSLDRQLSHAYIDKLPADQLAAIRRLLEGMLDMRIRGFEAVKAIAIEDALGDLGLTLAEFERMSHN